MFENSARGRNIELDPKQHSPSDGGPARLTPVVVRSVAIFDLLARSGPLRVSDIARELQLPKNSVHELVHTWAYFGCLAATAEDPYKFGLGVRLHEFGSAYLNGLDLPVLARPIAQRLSVATGETVQVGVLDGMDVVYLVKVDSPQAVRMVSREGSRLPASCTGIGKALLSGLTDDEVRDRYAGVSQLPTMTANSIASLHGLLAAVAEVRTTGMALDRGESNDDVCCVAAPVRDRTGAVVAALSVATPTHRLGSGWPGEHSELVMAGARDLSRLMGSHPGSAV